MARGWQSKSVEDQISVVDSRRLPKPAPGPDPAVLDRLKQKQVMLLTRTRVLHDLETAVNPRYQIQIRAALADLDRRLAELG